MTDQLWACVYCGKAKTSPNGTGSDVSCCGEVGHVEGPVHEIDGQLAWPEPVFTREGWA